MAMIIPCQDTDVLNLEDFVEHIESKIDRSNAQSLASAAPVLRAVANNRQIILAALHQEMREMFAHRRVATSQVIVLGGGSDFYLRADVWPSAADAAKLIYHEQAHLYRVGISQNFPCLMTGYSGPGLINDIYTYPVQSVVGYVGEPVDLKFVERIRLTTDTVVLFLPQAEAVQCVAPETFSISISLMIYRESGEHYSFDVKNRTLLDFNAVLPGSRRAALFRLAGLIGDSDTKQHLDEISKTNPCVRTRLAAYEALANLMPTKSTEIWARASSDPAAAIQRRARQVLDLAQD